MASGALWLGLVVSGCGGRRPAIVSAAEQELARDRIARYRAWALEPARIPPPGVVPGPLTAEAGALTGTATLVLPEDAPWNRWGLMGRPLLFNNRVAVLFDVDVEGPGEIRWVPERTVLEVNTPEHRLRAVPTAEHLLAELSWYAIQQEKWVLDGDLVRRTRAAGGFREAFVRDGDGLHGVIPFAWADPDRHVGALRLTVAVTVDGVPAELVWVFQ